MASSNVVGVVPVDHASSPLNSPLRRSTDTTGPHTVVGRMRQFRPKRAKESEGSCTLIECERGCLDKELPHLS